MHGGIFSKDRKSEVRQLHGFLLRCLINVFQDSGALHLYQLLGYHFGSKPTLLHSPL